MIQASACRMPDTLKTNEGKERRVGVEIELSGLGYDKLVTLVASLLEATPVLQSRYVTTLQTALGEFTVELDCDPIKDLDLADERLPQSIRELGGQAMNVIDAAAERIVPLEIISPPLNFSSVAMIETLVDNLRSAGARGSRNAIYFAFGLQLNPELPDLRPETMVRYFQAFAVLYDWLKSRHQLDVSRKFTAFIEPWHGRYTELLVDDNYHPNLDELMEDYLEFNPTRNRALDLLPLFTHLDRERVERRVRDPRIKGRPTLHYRLPDCDIDNPGWHFSTVWNDWIPLEQLANNPDDLADMRRLFRQRRQLNLHNLTHSWRETTDDWLARNGYV